MTDDDARGTTLALLAARSRQATVCPSEVARALAAASGSGASADWRGRMPLVHAAVDRLLAEGRIRLSWRNRSLDARNGPYRIGHADRATAGPADPPA